MNVTRTDQTDNLVRTWLETNRNNCGVRCEDWSGKGFGMFSLCPLRKRSRRSASCASRFGTI